MCVVAGEERGQAAGTAVHPQLFHRGASSRTSASSSASGSHRGHGRGGIILLQLHAANVHTLLKSHSVATTHTHATCTHYRYCSCRGLTTLGLLLATQRPCPVLLMSWQDDTWVKDLAADRVLLVDWAPMVHVLVSSTSGKVRDECMMC